MGSKVLCEISFLALQGEALDSQVWGLHSWTMESDIEANLDGGVIFMLAPFSLLHTDIYNLESVGGNIFVIME